MGLFIHGTEGKEIENVRTYRITDYLSQPELLTQLAEEAAELAQAALKLRRALTGENPTPVTVTQAVHDLNEEIADVRLCAGQIVYINPEFLEEIMRLKKERWIFRLRQNAERNEERGTKETECED